MSTIRINTQIPGPKSRALSERRAQAVPRGLSHGTPIYVAKAEDAWLEDVDGNRYIDCTAAFGVANAGHCNPRVTAAVLEQVERLVHGMGDVHPSAIRVRLFERLSQILPKGLDRIFLATTGSEAIEAALKTAMLYTGKTRFAAYRGGYHGLSFGALAVGGIDRFRAPFAAALGSEPLLLDFPKADGTLKAAEAASETNRRLSERDDIAALVVEPIQGRAGIILPPPGYLRALRAVCDERQIVMIVDEIYTGFGRTGAWFAVEREGVVPDILCIGKAMGSGFPISAAAGRLQVMDAWPISSGEALHTSTYLGHPVGCAAAVATIDEIERLQLPERARRLGSELGSRLRELSSRGIVEVRGRGFLWGIAFHDAELAAAVVKRALRAGAIFLQSGIRGEVIAISPPLVMGEEQLARALEILKVAIEETA